MAQPVDFGDTIMEGGISPSTPQMSPVEDRSGEYLAAGLGEALQGVGTIFGGVLKGNQEAQSNSVLNSYRHEITTLADAVDQGGLSRQAARSRMRQKYSEFIADNPALAEDIDKLNSTLLSENGVGHVIQTGNEQAQREEKLANEAYANGWQYADGTPDTGGYVNYQNAVRASETELKAIQLRTAQRGEVSAIDQERTRVLISNMAQAGMPWVDEQIARAAKLVDEGADPAETLLKLKADIGKVTGEFSTNSSGIDIGYILEPINQRLALFEDMVTGKTTTEVMNAKIAGVKAKADYAARMDPELGSLLVMSELFGQNAGPMIQQKLTTKSVELMTKLLYGYDETSDTNSPPPDLIGTEGDINSAFTDLKEKMIAGIKEPTPKMEEEVGAIMTNTLRSIGRYGAETVKDYRAVVDFLADPAVEKWVASGKLTIPKGVQEKASRAIQEQYEGVLLPIVEETWLTQTVTASRAIPGGMVDKNVPVSEVIEPVWNGSTISFKPKAEYANDARVIGTANAMNAGENSIAGPLNTLIRAKAHMNGTTEYGKEWELFGPRLFDMEADSEKKADTGSTANDGVTLADFNEELENNYVEKFAEVVSSTADEGLSNYFNVTRSRESAGNDSAKNELSSATGRYQFLEGTWNDLIKKYPDAGLTRDGRKDGAQQEIAMRLFTRDNARVLENNSIPINGGNLYAAHFLGVGTAVEVLTSPNNTALVEILSPRTIKANPFLRGMTVSKFKAWAAKRFT